MWLLSFIALKRFLHVEAAGENYTGPILLELLEPDEQANILELYESFRPKPLTIRSNSVSGSADIAYNERNIKKRRLHQPLPKRDLRPQHKYMHRRRHSLEIMVHVNRAYNTDNFGKLNTITSNMDSVFMEQSVLDEINLTRESKIISPQLFQTSVPKKKQTPIPVRKSEPIYNGELTRTEKYKTVQSKLKTYIKNKEETLPMLNAEQKRKKIAIRRHLLTYNKNVEDQSTVRFCEHLDFRNNNETTTSKNSTYYADLTAENLREFTGSDHKTHHYNRFLNVFEWLLSINKCSAFDCIPEDHDSHQTQSSVMIKNDDKCIMSVLKLNTENITPIKAIDPKVSNNIILPKLKVQINPPVQLEPTYYAYDEKFALDFVNNYNKSKVPVNKNADVDVKNSILSNLNLHNRQFVRNKLKSAQRSTDYLIDEIKLNNFIF